MSEPADLQVARARLDRAQMALIEAWRTADTDTEDPMAWAREARPHLYGKLVAAQRRAAAAAERRPRQPLPDDLRRRLARDAGAPSASLRGGTHQTVTRWARTETDPDRARTLLEADDPELARLVARHFGFPDSAFLGAALAAGAGPELAENPALTDAERRLVANHAVESLFADRRFPDGEIGQLTLRRLAEAGGTLDRDHLARLLRAVRTAERQEEGTRRDLCLGALVPWADRLGERTLRGLLRRHTGAHEHRDALWHALLRRPALEGATWRRLLAEGGDTSRQALSEILASRPQSLARHAFLRAWLADEGTYPEKLAAAAAAPADEARRILADAIVDDPKQALAALETYRDELADRLTPDLFRAALAADREAIREHAVRWMGRLREDLPEPDAPRPPRSR